MGVNITWESVTCAHLAPFLAQCLQAFNYSSINEKKNSCVSVCNYEKQFPDKTYKFFHTYTGQPLFLPALSPHSRYVCVGGKKKETNKTQPEVFHVPKQTLKTRCFFLFPPLLRGLNNKPRSLSTCCLFGLLTQLRGEMPSLHLQPREQSGGYFQASVNTIHHSAAKNIKGIFLPLPPLPRPSSDLAAWVSNERNYPLRPAITSMTPPLMLALTTS